VSTGSGGERILSDTYVNFNNLRGKQNHFCAINTSSKDHDRVKLLFKQRKIEDYKNFHTITIGEEELGGFGAGKNRSLGLSAYRADRANVLQKIKRLHSSDRFKIAFTLTTLGGGCGSLTAPEISKDIRDERTGHKSCTYMYDSLQKGGYAANRQRYCWSKGDLKVRFKPINLRQ